MFLSIIIPIYNVEQYIEKCILSCERQNIEKSDYEIICINDGSTDRSEEIVKALKNNYNNIVALSQKNKGVSCARNLGLEKARGEYIWFVDGDDFVQENVLSDIKSILKGSNCKRLKIGVYRNESIVLEDMGSRQIESNRDIDYLFSSIFAKKVIDNNGLKFVEELSYYEDVLFLFDYENCCSDFEIFNPQYATYYYRENQNSATYLSSEYKVIKLIYSLFEVVRISLSRISDNTYDQEKNFWFWRSKMDDLIYKYLPKLAIKPRRDILISIKKEDLIYTCYWNENSETFSPAMKKTIKKESTRIKRELAFYSSFVGAFLVPLNIKVFLLKKKMFRIIKHPRRSIKELIKRSGMSSND